jgi:serine protease inhibitor
MHQSTQLRFASTPNYEAVDLLYGNSAFAMTVVLPRPGVDINAVAGSMTEAGWKSLTESFAERQGELALPRFKLEWKRLLKDDLIALGMGPAFDFRVADFSRMSPNDLYITKVLQKTFVDVNEEGTEAAAVTSVGIGPTSAPPAFIVDRPFLFVIRERFSGTILFMGRILKLPAE